jgi:hypothetical protein
VEANPVFVTDPSIPWEAGGAVPLEILPYDDGWIMFYLGGNADQTTWSVGYAISEDGLNWTQFEGNPVFVLDPDLGPYGVTDFSVFTTGEQWVMLFVAAGNTRVQGIKVATAPSPEGPWTIADDLALPAPHIMEWDGMGIAAQMVTRAGDSYVMYFGSDGAIGRATSPDGFDWTLYDDSDPVIRCSRPILIRVPGTRVMSMVRWFCPQRMAGRCSTPVEMGMGMTALATLPAPMASAGHGRVMGRSSQTHRCIRLPL